MKTIPPALNRSIFLRPIAHRGLHDTSAGMIENTAAAFAAAIASGYGIECDLRPLADGTPIVFHDATLDRLIDATGPVSALTPTDLSRLRYRGSNERILTFADLLYLVGGVLPGRVKAHGNDAVARFETPTPLLVEIKSEWQPPDLVFLTAIAQQASRYHGPIALMSFDPAVIAALQTLAPTVPRGLVSGSYVSAAGDHWWQGQLAPERAARLRDLTDFDAVGASFAAYEVAALPTSATTALRARNIPLFTWTVRTDADLALAAPHADAMIFEGFMPRV